MVKAKKAATKKATKRADKSLEAPLYNKVGEVVGKIKLPKEIFAQKQNKVLVAQVIRVYLAKQKPRLASTKTRAEVSGGGRKPHRQKGTGRARVGSIRIPEWRGGGVAFGPKPKEVNLTVPKKMRQISLTVVLSEKFNEEGLAFIDKLDFKEPKTKKAKQLIEKLPAPKRKNNLLLVLEVGSEAIIKSFRNLENVAITQALDLNTLDVLKSSGLIFTREALEILEGRFKHETDKSD